MIERVWGRLFRKPMGTETPLSATMEQECALSASSRTLAHWTPEELAVLKPDQLSTTPPLAVVRKPTLPEEPTRRPPPRHLQAEPYHGFRTFKNTDDLPVDASLPIVTLTVRSGEVLRPVIDAEPVEPTDGREALYYFEFDTVESFDSPNFWRSPQLLPFQAEPNIAGRAGVAYNVFRSGHHNPPNGPSASFEFRAAAMRLPTDWQALDQCELEKQALALGFGLDRRSTVREIFNFIRHFVTWSDQKTVRSSLDVFCSGVAPCGQANALCALMLEFNGIRSRGVSGFDPAVRTQTGGRGGHSAAEVYDPALGRWEYCDPYLDLYLPGVSVAEFDTNPHGDLLLGAHHSLRPLKRQFMYRRYFDRLNRMIPINMLQMGGGGDESSWGTQWPLVTPRHFEPQELFPEEITIHVRARYVLTNGQRVQHRSEVPIEAPTQGIVASPWAHTSFTIRPRQLLGIA